MTREQAINYLRSSGFSEEQIQEIVKALEQETVIDPVIESAYKTGYEMGRSITMIESVR